MSDARRKRTLKRASARDAAKLARDRERLFTLEAGGNPARPIDVTSAAVVETRALTLACPRCEGSFRVLAHDAVTLGGVRLRKVQVRCTVCAAPREVWLRVQESLN